MLTFHQFMLKYGRSIYMISKNIKEKLKTVSSLALQAMGGRAILWHALMENGAIFYRLPISAFIQKGFDPKSAHKTT